ncbi:hypothetical protein [Entomobacter blattae]|uniref:Lipoprotein n=1 Tax=Entomobacter blattae TaxID=2762277 RepID=A0A7H1NS51_9PROT|nr:hypothetical protein [Entomobacter blattae]QNT78611.1 hypothetical protein JGUZn3_13860 [Entomobacter blattae]
MKQYFKLYSLFFLVLIAVPAKAQSCGNNTVANLDNISTAIVLESKTHFIADENEIQKCPSSNVQCQKKSYLVSGDTVLLTEQKNSKFVCASYVSAKGNLFQGWLSKDSLKLIPAEEATNNDWNGIWKTNRGSNSSIITIKSSENTYTITGEAEWQGMNDVINTGEISGTIKLNNNILAFVMNSMNGKTLPYTEENTNNCKIKMIKKGPYLLAESNLACGGMNVTFSGIYHRQASVKIDNR